MRRPLGQNLPIYIEDIIKILPHRYPMLLVDRILGFEPMKSCRGLKNVTMNEAFFQGHYPGKPVMPGVLILEAMAQAGCMLFLMNPDINDRLPLIGSIDKVKLKRPVVPGDTLITDTELVWFRDPYGCMRATANVDGQLVATMEMTFKLVVGEKPESDAEGNSGGAES
ncbi:MAG: 3-hydroxyacyl-ACP dehydratase FabZ [Fimbriimonadaceae bacterium]